MNALPPAPFGRVLSAMVTPFDADGGLDLPAAQHLAQWLVEQGNEGLVLNGTTGESPTLSSAESLELFRAVRDVVNVPLIAGTGSNDTAHAIRQSAAAADIGADALMLVCPYYNRPSQAGLNLHFRKVAACTDLPVMLYDIPTRSGRKIASETIIELATEVDNIVALKDAAGDPGETARVIAKTPEAFAVYSGDDGLTLPLLSVGAVGVVSVAAHWAAREFGKMIAAFNRGDVVEARKWNQRLIPSCRFESSLAAPNPVPTKAMLRALGLDVGECRLPMGPTPNGLEDEAMAIYRELASF